MVKLDMPLGRHTYTLIAPRPIVLVTSVAEGLRPNIIPIAAVTGASHEPPMLVISVHHNRYSHQLIETSKEFAINVPTTSLKEQIQFCGRNSGSKVDKFKETKLTPVKATVIKAPIIAECPINIECKVVAAIRPGTHTLFVGQAVAAHVEEGAFDGSKVNLKQFPTIGYNQPEFLAPGNVV
jgi:flavin reductase (DIM6/NTAB) family NADH-FMN oxidoreductase RutF